MTPRSLILHPHEVRAALAGTLGLVVRPVKPQPEYQDATGRWTFCVSSTDKNSRNKWSYCVIDADGHHYTERGHERCVLSLRDPFGVPGDRMRCKEGWADVNTESGPAVTYCADNGLHFCQDDAFPIEYDRYPGMKFTMWCGDLWRGEPGHSWRSPATMPAWASRITLEVVGVRCVRCTGITYEDAEKSGVADAALGTRGMSPLTVLRDTWTAKYGRRYPWDTSWAWAVGVRRVEG